jgi:hypothetical protein
MLPELGRSRHAIQNASVLFPEPDSPTSANVDLAETEKETPRNAVTFLPAANKRVFS